MLKRVSQTHDHAWNPSCVVTGRAFFLALRITEKFTSATPRLFAKFNYRIKWFDGWENHKLNLEDYNSGPAAPYNSWALLEKED